MASRGELFFRIGEGVRAKSNLAKSTTRQVDDDDDDDVRFRGQRSNKMGSNCYVSHELRDSVQEQAVLNAST